MYMERDDIIGYVSPEPADKDPGWLLIVVIVAVMGAIVSFMIVAGLILLIKKVRTKPKDDV